MSALLEHHSWLHREGRPLLAPEGRFDDSLWTTKIRVHKFTADQVSEFVDKRGEYLKTVEREEPSWDDFVRFGIKPGDGVVTEQGNLMTTAGLNLLTSLFEGAGGNAFNHTNAIVGVGSSSTAAAVGDTALGGNGSSASAYYQQADASYPSQANGLITCYCTFGSSNGNFVWNEWCLADGSGGITAGSTLASVATGVVMINHKIASLGTKGSWASWTAQTTITES